jgi:hypothetical protein
MWSASLFGIGLFFSFLAFVRSLTSRATAPPLLIPFLLSLFHGALIGVSLIVGALLLWPATAQSLPPLEKPITVREAHAVVWIPAGWNAVPLHSGDIGISIEAASPDTFLTMQEMKVVFKERTIAQRTIETSVEPVNNTFTVRKLWLTFHQVSVIGPKGEKFLCSVSAASLPPHFNFAKDLCNAVFKKIEVPATIKQ